MPGVHEVIKYQMPGYKLQGSPVLSFAGWKRHYSLYGATAQLVAAVKDELAPYEVGKGTISFPLSQPVLMKLIERIAKLRAKGLPNGRRRSCHGQRRSADERVRQSRG